MPTSFSLSLLHSFITLFFFNDPATTEIYTLSLHDALPISPPRSGSAPLRLHSPPPPRRKPRQRRGGGGEDRKSTRLNSSHVAISYAVFCLKKKKKKKKYNHVLTLKFSCDDRCTLNQIRLVC